jgi:uncharacterized protein (PEP-CTERM system associated)
MIFAQRPLRAVTIAAVGTIAAATHAQESELGAVVGLMVAHSDNVALAPSGFEESEVVSEVTAGINFSQARSRFQSTLDYEVQGVFYNEIENADEVFHRLDADSRLALVADRFFLDAFGVYDQTIKDPTSKYSLNNIALTGNRTDVAIIGLSPNVALDFGSNVAGEVRYTHTKLNYEDEELIDTNEEVLLFTLANSKTRDGASWGLSYSHERFDYGAQAEIELQTFELELGHWVNPGLRVFTTQGLESDYDALLEGVEQVDSGLDEHFWYVGTEWRPDEQTLFSVSVGERSFGTARRFSWNRTMRYGGIQVGYSEEPSTFLREQLNGVRYAGELSPIDSLDGPMGNLLYLQERTDVAFFVDRPKSKAGVRLFKDNRFDIASDTEAVGARADSLIGTELTLEWDFANRTSLNGLLQRAQRKSVANVIDDELLTLSVEIVRRVGRQNDLSFVLARTRSEPGEASGNPSQFEYSESRFSIQIERSFGERGETASAVERFSDYVDAGQNR